MLVEKTQPIYSISAIRNYRWSIHLDLLRGLASLLVFLGHTRALFFLQYSEVSNPNSFVKGLYLLTGLGRESVMIFIVLSGFLISTSVIKTVKQNKWSWVNYLVARLTRLYVVLIPALCLTAFWDVLGVTIFGTGQDSFYGEKIYNEYSLSYRVLESFTWQNFLGNLAFLQTIFVDFFGSNKVVWTLAYEFWYYILFPAIFLFLNVKSLKWRVIYAVLTSAILLMVGAEIRVYFLVWLLGTLVSIAHPSKYLNKRKNLNLCITLSILSLCAFMTLSCITKQPILNLFIGIAAALTIYFLANDRTQVKHQGLYEKFAQGLAAGSYTLYLVHVPLLCFIRACLIKDRPWEPDIFHLFLALLIVTFVFLYSVVVYHFTEAKTENVKKFVMSWVKRKNLTQA